MSEQELVVDTGVILSEDTTVTMPALTDTPTESVQRKKKPKKRVFWIGFIIYTVLLCIAAGTVLWILNGALVDYEATTPNAALKQYTTWIREKNYEAIFEHSDFELSLLNTKEEYLKYLARVFDGNPKDITFRERVSLQPEEKLYSVYFDTTRVGIVSLSSRLMDGKTRWYVHLQPVFQNDYTLICDSNARITINGNELSLLGFEPEEIQANYFAGLEDASLYPTVYRYTVSGLLNEPSFEALSLDGTPCAITYDEAAAEQVRITHAYAAAETQAQQEFAVDAATTYAKFIARDATWAKIKPFIYKESALYDALRNFTNMWFTSHDSYKFNDLTVSAYSNFSDSDFTCEVKFQPVYTKNGRTFNGEPAHYRITALKFDGEWKVISLAPVLETETPNTDTATQQP